MTRKIEAIYENGVLRPLGTLDGIAEHARVKLAVESVQVPGDGLAECIGTLPDEDAEEMRRMIEGEFERIDPNEW